MYFIDSKDDQFLKIFSPMFNSLTLDNNNQKSLNAYQLEYLQRKLNCLAMIMSNLGNGRVSMKLSNPISVQKTPSSLYSNFF